MNKDKILITGGSGFLGKAICKLASQQDQPIISLSRNGKPSGIKEEDYRCVQWVSANIFNPGDWKHLLTPCKAVIHCIGIVEEQPETGITYEKMILGSAIVIGNEVKEAAIQKMVYISAGGAAPETPATYMKMKKAAENYLHSLPLDVTILRPGMLYGADKPETLIENEHIQQLLDDPNVYPGLKANRPLSVDVVAAAALQSALGQITLPVLSVDDMDSLIKH